MRKSKKTRFIPRKKVRLKKKHANDQERSKNHDLEHAIDQEKKSKF